MLSRSCLSWYEVTYNGRYQNTGIFLLKYLGRHGGNDGAVGEVDMGWDNNQRIYRYSETLLNAAELILRTGGDAAKAQGYYNDIISLASFHVRK